jgi:transposase
LIQKAYKTPVQPLKKVMTQEKKAGVKVHLGVDIIGMPHTITATPANVSDRDGAAEMIALFRGRLTGILKVLCDGGYTGDVFAAVIDELIGAAVETAKRSDLHKFVVIPKRWVVERTFGWLDKYRSFWKNCDKYSHNLVQLIVFAFIRLILKRFLTGS